jgi:uncharacterized membrane protein
VSLLKVVTAKGVNLTIPDNGYKARIYGLLKVFESIKSGGVLISQQSLYNTFCNQVLVIKVSLKSEKSRCQTW